MAVHGMQPTGLRSATPRDPLLVLAPLLGTAMERPMIARATVHQSNLSACQYKPQWSRPVIGRATSPRRMQYGSDSLPQWSRPVIGRATARVIRAD